MGTGVEMFEVKRSQKESTTSRLSQHVIKNFDNWRLGCAYPSKVSSPYKIPLIAAVGGGKGGVGKSIISANLGAALAQCGYRVLVMDLDLGCSNLHSHFGISMPKKSLADFFVTKKYSFRDVILPAPVHGLAFVAGGREDQLLETFEAKQGPIKSLWEVIYNCKKDFRVDIVLLDLGAGTHRHTLDLFVGSHLGLVTVLPEPTSIENAYVFLKMSLQKLIHNVGRNTRSMDAAEDILSGFGTMSGGSLNKGYAYYLQNLKISYPRFIHNFSQAVLGRYAGIIINQTREQADADIGNSMEHICQKYFGLQSKFIGSLNYDENVVKALKNRRLLVTEYPHSQIANRLANSAAHCLNVMGLRGRI